MITNNLAQHFFRFVSVLVVICAIGLPSVASSTVYYVSSSEGRDGNTGTTPTAPWKTLKKVGSKNVLPGDRIALKKGDVWYETFTFSSSGSANSKIMITSYGEGENPRINGSTAINDWSQLRPSAVYTSRYKGICNGLLEDSKPLKRSLSAELSDGQWFFDGSQIYYKPTSGSPSSHVVERCARGSLLHIKEQNHIIIESLTFYGANNYGIRIIDSSDIEIRNCKIANNGQDGISLQRFRPEVKCSRIMIIDNVLEFNADGIYITGKDDGFKSDGYSHCEIKNNTVSHTNYQNVWGHNTKDGHAIGIQNSSFCNIEGNTITENYSGIALWTSDQYISQGNVFTRNLIANNHLYGIVHGANGKNNSWGHTFSFNMIVNNGHWPGQWGGLRINRVQDKGNYYFNNTLYGNDINIYLYSLPDYHVVKNNLSLEPLRFHVWLDSSAGKHNVIDNNCYFSKKTDVFHSRTPKNITFAEWKQKTAQDKASVFADPAMRTRSPQKPEDFCISQNSPCLRKGDNKKLNIPAKDFFGNAVTSLRGSGACSFTSK